jgi:hypothetical protein
MGTVRPAFGDRSQKWSHSFPDWPFRVHVVGQFGRPARATLYKIQFNGAGGSRTYIGFTHSAFQ